MNFSFEPGSNFGKVKIADKVYDTRLAVGVVGLVFWLAMLFVTTGVYGVYAIRDEAIFLGFLILVALPVITIPLSNLWSTFFYGAFCMGIASILCKMAHAVSNDAGFTLVPLIETPLYLAPAILFLWRRRKFFSWELGATDIMLLCAFAGAGFELVELAAIQAHTGSDLAGSPLFMMPTAYEWGDRIRGTHVLNGQAIWATIAGATIGIASYFRTQKWWIPVAMTGVFWAWLDHFVVNLHADSIAGGGVSFLNFVVGKGYLTTYLCFIGILACVGLDLYLNLKKFPENMKPDASNVAPKFSRPWLFVVLSTRRLAYSYYRIINANGPERDYAIRMHGIGRERILKFGHTPPAPADETAIGIRPDAIENRKTESTNEILPVETPTET